VTSQAVALTRALLDRPHSLDGDPRAQQALCADMRISPPKWLASGIAARTRFIDTQVVRALADGIGQVVICGAGYDDRALRFRTAGVRFIELDHPATQSDKARLLANLDTVAADVTLAPIDFRDDDIGTVLARAGHTACEASLFVAEGLLVYLDQRVCERLMMALAERAAPGSALVASLATHADGYASAEVVAAANSRRRASAAEPWLTILPVEEHLDVLTNAGWQVIASAWAPTASPDVSHGLRTLLVAARI
jgi:methyltransferase (TIGR00027 family)